MLNRKQETILHISMALYYAALLAIMLSLILSEVVKHPNWFLGMLICCSALPELVLYFVNKHYKNKYKLPSIIIVSICVVDGLIVIAHTSMATYAVCVMWGILDILRGINDVFQSAIEIKDDKSIIIKGIVGLASVVVGILLCIHLEDGILFHLTMLGVSIAILTLFEIIKAIKIKRWYKDEID